MSDDHPVDPSPVQLPVEFSDRLRRPFSHFLRIEAAGGAILLTFAVAALAVSNSPWADQIAEVWEIRAGFEVGALEYARSLKR